MILPGHAKLMGDVRKAYKISARKLERKIQFERLSNNWEDNIEVGLTRNWM
jgi:hypothetical protein